MQAEEDLAVLLEHVGSDRRPPRCGRRAGWPGPPPRRASPRTAAGVVRVYEALFARYGLALTLGYTWLDVAELLNTVVEGSAQRILADARVRLSNGYGVLAASLRLMITSLASLPPGTSLDELYPVAPS